jgi:MerR family transcriptional regulator, heat shock protein HspR
VAAEILGLHPRTLRIYEEHGLVVPFRTPTQRRRYSQADIKKTRFIQYLTQNRRVNLEGVKIIFFMLEELQSLGIAQPIQHIFNDYRESD